MPLTVHASAATPTTDTLITGYDTSVWTGAAMGVVHFTQTLTIGGHTARFACIVTIVCTQLEGQWQEARWHASMLDTEVPEGFPGA